jgi:hypothetical protein
MFERGSKAADHLSDQTFINFEGLRKVSGCWASMDARLTLWNG